jgi:dihydrofolate reductase
MRISLIAAMAKNRVIGRDNRLPWHLPADLRRFKALTTGAAVVMGRRTWDSLPLRPLPGRVNIVVSRTADFCPPGCRVRTSLEGAVRAAQGLGCRELFVIGGAEVYAQALDFAERLYLTEIDLEVDGDAYFPEWNAEEWEETVRLGFPAAESNPAYSFVTLEHVGRCL